MEKEQKRPGANCVVLLTFRLLTMLTNNGYNCSSEVRIVSLEDVRSLFDGLPVEDKEQFLGQSLSDLPAESQMKVLGKQLGESGLVVVMGASNCSVNSDLCVQIQNAPNLDVEAIIEAVIARRQRERKN